MTMTRVSHQRQENNTDNTSAAVYFTDQPCALYSASNPGGHTTNHATRTLITASPVNA
jgi:hypothetical protein